MGYSITTPIQTPALRDRLWTFMEANYREPHTIFPQKFSYSRLCKNGDLSYDDGECRIGFDYNSCFPEREYVFCICRWMSIVAGKVKEFPDNNLTAIPYFVYDGEEDCPVIIEGSQELQEGLGYVDNLGWRKSDECMIFPDGKKDDKIIKKAIESLNRKWKEENK